MSVPLPAWAVGVAASPSRVTVLGAAETGAHVVLVADALPSAKAVVMKHYPDGSGSRAAVTMRTLATAVSARPGASLHIPRVVAWHPQPRVLVQDVAPGEPLLPLLTSRRRRTALIAAARGLAELHALPVRAGHRARMPQHLAELVRPHPLQLADDWEALGPGLRAVTEAVLAWDRTRSQPRAVPIHRDAHPRQMLLDGHRLWVVDWDLAACGDAALDVANFTVYLRTRAGTGGSAAAATFLEAYTRVAGDLTPRLPWFAAFTYVRLIAKAYRLRPAGWRRQARTWLQQAEAALAQAPSP